MFTLQVLGLGPLRSSIFPLLAVADSADLKCSPTSVSLTVSYTENESHCFYAALQMFSPFFTIFSGGNGDYQCEIDLAEFSQLILEDLYLTILIPTPLTSVTLISSTRGGNFQSLDSMWVMPPKNEGVGKFDRQLFVAIDATKFKEIATQLSDDDGPIWATASTSQVRFCVRRTTGEIIREIVLTTKRRECLAGGFYDQISEIHFSFTLKPKDFFHRASDLTKLVWFFKSTRWQTTLICFTRQWTNILACYPRISYKSCLFHSFSLTRKIIARSKTVKCRK